jgi:hypothetical protein
MRSLPALLLAAGLLVLACGCTAPGTTNATPASRWTFVVVGDSRAAGGDTATGVSPDLPVIASAIAAEEPAFVIFSGDLIIGSGVNDSSPVHGDYRAQFEHWETAMRPVHDYAAGTGVPVYVVRGNHEDGSDRLLEAYLATVAQGMPENGPPGEVCLTYAFSYGGARFIGLDEYVPHRGQTETVDQAWLDGTLDATTEPIRIVFGWAWAGPVKTWENRMKSERIARTATGTPFPFRTSFSTSPFPRLPLRVCRKKKNECRKRPGVI